MQSIEFIALHENAVLPQVNGADSVCLDLCSCEDVLLDYGRATLVNTGLVLHHNSRSLVSELSLSMRSGFSLKTSTMLTNAPGIVEPSYVGFVKDKTKLCGIGLSMITFHSEPVLIKAGDRIAQLRITSAEGKLLIPGKDFDVLPLREYYTSVEDWALFVSDLDVARGGFGSTGV